MSQTSIRGAQILNNTVQRQDLDTSTVGQALITKVVQGSGIALSSTGADSGTGDVTISGVSAVSTDAGNQSRLGSDNLIYTPAPIVTPDAQGWLPGNYNRLQWQEEFLTANVSLSANGWLATAPLAWYFYILAGGSSAAATYGNDRFNKAYGIAYIATGAAGTGVILTHLEGGSPGYGGIVPGLGPCDFYFRVAYNAMPSSASFRYFCGFNDSYSAITSNLMALTVQYNAGAGGAAWAPYKVTSGASNTGTGYVTSPALVSWSASAATFYKCKMSINAGWTTATFYVNGVSVGSLSSLPTPANGIWWPFFYVDTSVSTACGLMIDFCALDYQFAR
jgi:hypothetical protein